MQHGWVQLLSKLILNFRSLKASTFWIPAGLPHTIRWCCRLPPIPGDSTCPDIAFVTWLLADIWPAITSPLESTQIRRSLSSKNKTLRRHLFPQLQTYCRMFRRWLCSMPRHTTLHVRFCSSLERRASCTAIQMPKVCFCLQMGGRLCCSVLCYQARTVPPESHAGHHRLWSEHSNPSSYWKQWCYLYS